MQIEKYQGRISEQWADITANSVDLAKLRAELEVVSRERAQYLEQIAK
jgi:hypothetical protein